MSVLADELLAKRRSIIAQLERVRRVRKDLTAQEADLLRDLKAWREAARLLNVEISEDDGVDWSTLTSSVSQFVHAKLKAAGPEGVKAQEVTAAYEAATGTRLHPKTVGMTLWRLKKDGRAERIGTRIWRAA